MIIGGNDNDGDMKDNDISIDLPDQVGFLRATMLALLIMVGAYVVRIIVHIFVANNLGVEIYGDFVFTLRLLFVCSIIVLFGADKAVLKFVPEYLSHQKWGFLMGYLRRHTKLILILSIAFAVCSTIIVGMGLLAERLGYIELFNYHPALLAFWILPLIALSAFFSRLLRSINQLALSVISLKFLPNALLGIGVFAVAYFSTLNLTQALVIFGFSWFFVILLQVIVAAYVMPKNMVRAAPAYQNKRWLMLSSQFFLIGIALVALRSIDLIMLEILGIHERNVGIFASILMLANVMRVFLNSAIMVSAPYISMAVHRKEFYKLQGLVYKNQMVLQTISVVTIFVFFLYGKLFLSWFGSDFVEGYPFLLLAIIAYAFVSSFGIGEAVLQYSGNQRTLVAINFSALIVAMIADSVLIPMYDLEGAIVGLLLGSLVSVALLIIYVRRKVGVKLLYLI